MKKAILVLILASSALFARADHFTRHDNSLHSSGYQGGQIIIAQNHHGDNIIVQQPPRRCGDEHVVITPKKIEREVRRFFKKVF